MPRSRFERGEQLRALSDRSPVAPCVPIGEARRVATPDTNRSATDRVLLAIALRLLSVVLFAFMNVGIKLAEARGASLPEIMFWRQFGATLLVGGIVASGPGVASLKTRRFGAHVLRTVLGSPRWR